MCWHCNSYSCGSFKKIDFIYLFYLFYVFIPVESVYITAFVLESEKYKPYLKNNDLTNGNSSNSCKVIGFFSSCHSACSGKNSYMNSFGSVKK